VTLTSLLCFPYAGAGAGSFRTWQERYPLHHMTVLPVQLPGREELFTEPPCSTMEDIVERCIPLARKTAATTPIALFGHSFGAIVAYEVARRLTTEGINIEHLVVSGAAAPQLPRPGSDIVTLNNGAFVSGVRELAGYDHPALHDPELRELLLPAFRADLAINGSYTPSGTSPLPVPVTVLLGTDDDMVAPHEAELWSKTSSVGSELIHMPGGHMYFAPDPSSLATTLDRLLMPGPRPPAGPGVSGAE
jgi:surfactin synthase thioesterase subunit